MVLALRARIPLIAVQLTVGVKAGTVILLRLLQLALWLAFAVVGVLLILAVLYFAHGSLEEFPTPEDTSKVRTVAGVGAVLLLGVELALVVFLRRVAHAARARSVNSAVPPAA